MILHEAERIDRWEPRLLVSQKGTEDGKKKDKMLLPTEITTLLTLLLSGAMCGFSLRRHSSGNLSFCAAKVQMFFPSFLLGEQRHVRRRQREDDGSQVGLGVGCTDLLSHPELISVLLLLLSRCPLDTNLLPFPVFGSWARLIERYNNPSSSSFFLSKRGKLPFSFLSLSLLTASSQARA